MPKPDLAIVHGDRHEVLGAVVGMNARGIPIAHIGGGDVTEGSQDDCFRHAITKLSHLHFASHQEVAERIDQMGEDPDRVYVTGCPGIDMVMATPTLGYTETMGAVGLLDGMTAKRDLKLGKCLLVLFHPNTLGDTAAELEALSVALSRRTEALVLLGPNADAGSDIIRREWQRLAANRPDTVYHDNVSPQVFYSLMKWCDVMVGNSSAGFYEAPYFGIPVVNIGDRQKGRPIPYNVGHTMFSADPAAISITITKMMDLGRLSQQIGLYGDGHAAERIAKVIGEIKEPKALLRKKFRDISHEKYDHRLDGCCGD
jgi:UDP-hydrolysing UDP-N-acetyl-D-glucosamine 2-epimerase